MLDLHLRCNEDYIELEDLLFIELTDLCTLNDLHIDGDGQNISVTVVLRKVVDFPEQENIQLRKEEKDLDSFKDQL